MSAPATSSPFVSVRLACSHNSIDLRVLPAPATSDTIALKAQAFDFLQNSRIQHHNLFSMTEIIAAFPHLLINRSSAEIETNNIISLLSTSIYSVSNLSGLGFFSSTGSAIHVDANVVPEKRPNDICYFRFSSTLHAGSIDTRLVDSPSFDFIFMLALSQTTCSASVPAAAAALTASAMPSTPPKLAPADADTDWSIIGTPIGQDIFADYHTSILSSCTKKALQALVQRSMASPVRALFPNSLTPRRVPRKCPNS